MPSTSLHQPVASTETDLHWYVIFTKPREEARALLNLEQQGYTCYCPMICIEKQCRGKVSLVNEPMFSRYLFIQLDFSPFGKSWHSIRSTLGVSNLLMFGTEYARIDDQLLQSLRTRQAAFSQAPQALFKKGERVLIHEGPFSGLEAIYHSTSGENRALLLIEMLGKPTKLKLQPSSFQKSYP